MLLNVNTMINFKFRLQFEFRNNKNCSYIWPNCKFPYRVTLKKYITLRLKFRKNNNSHEKRIAHWYIFTYMLLKTLSSSSMTSLRSGFRNRFILGAFFSIALIILILFFHILWSAEFTRPNSRHTSAFFFQFSICRITLTLPSTLKFCLLFATVTMSFYQSPVNSRSRNAGEIFTHEVNYPYYCHFPVLELPERREGLHFQGRGDG